MLIVPKLYVISYYRIRSATINGTTYPKKAVVVCAIEDNLPVFGKIEDLIVTPSHECLFVLSILTTYSNRHFHCFEVIGTSSPELFVCRHRDLVDYHPLHICQQYGPNGNLSICLKYNVMKKK